MSNPTKLVTETNELYELFLQFYKLGSLRNLLRLSKNTNINIEELKLFRKKYNWDYRILEFEKIVKNQEQTNANSVKKSSKLNPNKIKNKIDNKIRSNPDNLDILLKLQENLNKCIQEFNEFAKPEKLFNEDDDAETKLTKVERVFRLMNLFLSILTKIEKKIATNDFSDLSKIEKNIAKLKIS